VCVGVSAGREFEKKHKLRHSRCVSVSVCFRCVGVRGVESCGPYHWVVHMHVYIIYVYVYIYVCIYVYYTYIVG
jgi:hypothetical protein